MFISLKEFIQTSQRLKLIECNVLICIFLSMSLGSALIVNLVYIADNCRVFFGTIQKLTAVLKAIKTTFYLYFKVLYIHKINQIQVLRL